VDTFEKIGYACLAVVAGCYVIALFAGVIAAFPYGLLVLVGLVGVGVLLIKVIRERLANKEDDYYSKNVEK